VLGALLVIFLCPLGRWTVPLATEVHELDEFEVVEAVFPRLSASWRRSAHGLASVEE
jgi:hypothetical protein